MHLRHVFDRRATMFASLERWQIELAACIDTSMRKTKRDLQPFEYRSVRYWSKEINGTLTGGRKRKFFNSRPRAPYGLRRPHQWNPVNPWS